MGGVSALYGLFYERREGGRDGGREGGRERGREGEGGRKTYLDDDLPV